jgi:hypothetical protein
LRYTTDERIQISDNVGEEQLNFDMGAVGVAMRKRAGTISAYFSSIARCIGAVA